MQDADGVERAKKLAAGPLGETLSKFPLLFAKGFGQGHHLRHWAQGGPTTLSNLALLCRRHHRAVHEEGFQVDRQPDGTLHLLRAGHVAQGLRIHARTACPGWLGERLDVGWAIDVLHPLAAGPPPTNDAPPS